MGNHPGTGVFASRRAATARERGSIRQVHSFSAASSLRFLEPAPDGSITITASENHVDRELLVIPKTMVTKYPNPNELADALNRNVLPNLARRSLPYRVEVPEWHERRQTIEYTIRRGSNGEPYIVRETWNPINECCVIGVAGPVGIFGFGWWLVRRVRNRRRLVS